MTIAAIYAALLCLCGIIAVGIEAIVHHHQARENAPNHPGEM